MPDNITCLQTIVDNKAKEKAYAIEQAGIAVSKVKMSPKDRWWDDKRKQREERLIKDYMDGNNISREDAITQIKEKEKQRQQESRAKIFYEKRIRKDLGEYVTGSGEYTEGLDGILHYHDGSIREINHLLTDIDNEYKGHIEDEQKNWLLQELRWKTYFHIEELEKTLKKITNKIDALNYNKD